MITCVMCAHMVHTPSLCILSSHSLSAFINTWIERGMMSPYLHLNGDQFYEYFEPRLDSKVQKYMCPGLTQPITVAIESHHYSQQTDIFRHQMNVSFLPNQLRRFINHNLRVVSHLIICFRDLLSQHHLLCAVKINPTCDNWGKDLTKDGEGSTWDTLCRARYTDLA